MLLRKWLDWFFLFEPKQRVCKKLEYYVCLGMVAEYYATRKNSSRLDHSLEA
jgi:hypothetical protein